MKTPTGKLPIVARIQKTFAEARFFSFSALFHLGLIAFLGSLVIFKSLPKDDEGFTSDPSDVGPLMDEQIRPDDQMQTVPSDSESSSAKPGEISDIPVTQSLIVTTGISPIVMISGLSSSNILGNSLEDGGARGMNGMGPGGGNAFGSRTTGGGPAAGLVGTFYDLKQTRTKSPTDVDPDEYQKIFRRFVREGWKETTLEKYFKAPTKLYTTQLFIPNMKAAEGPKAFGVEREVQPSRWLAVYKGRVSPPESGTYHFVGGGDDVLVVRFNGKVVLDRCWRHEGSDWKPVANYDYGFTGIPNGFAKGDAINVKVGQYYDIEILIGEQPGSYFYSCLLIEKQGEHYEKDSKGNPVVPVFRLMDRSIPELQEGETLPPYQKGGPVWKAAPLSSTGLSMLN